MPLSFEKPAPRPPKLRTRLKRGQAPRRRSRPRRQRRGDVAALIRQADELFRRIVAGRAVRCWNCWVHRAVKPLETAHHITRDAKAVRWNLANASPLCADCHRYFTREKALWVATWRDWIGGPAADEVERLAREGCRLTVPYMEAIVAGLKACV